MFLQNYHFSFQYKGKKTVCVVSRKRNLTKEEKIEKPKANYLLEKLASGSTSLSPKDNYCKSIARFLAFKKAMRKLRKENNTGESIIDKETSTKIWKDFVTQVRVLPSVKTTISLKSVISLQTEKSLKKINSLTVSA